MPKFSALSEQRLSTSDPRLQRVFREVVRYFDCTVLEGHRGEAAQNRYAEEGKSKLRWPNGAHNSVPSKAVDVVPYPVDWKDLPRICYFAGFVMATALSMGVSIRWGKDWDRDTDLNDQTFNDSPHFEIVE